MIKISCWLVRSTSALGLCFGSAPPPQGGTRFYVEPGREYQIRRLEPPDVQPLRRGVPDVDSDDEELPPGVCRRVRLQGVDVWDSHGA